MNDCLEMLNDLKNHLGLCREILGMVEKENQALRATVGSDFSGGNETRKKLAPVLTQSLKQLKKHRAAWQQLSQVDRSQYPEVTQLLRQNQDLIMKILVIDRENEQQLLRRGMIPPQQIPSVNRQRPHFVAQLYRKPY